MTQTSAKTGKVRSIRRVPVRARKVVYFIRHGQSEANAAPDGGSGILDPALTALGCRQAEALASETGSWGVEAVFVSPLLRTLQTACLAFPRPAPLEVTRSAREHGWTEPQNRGTPAGQLKERLAAACGPQAERLRGMGKLRTPHRFWDPEGEPCQTRRELRHRRREASQFLMRKLLHSGAGTLACVSHYCVAKRISGVHLGNAQAVRCTIVWGAEDRWSVEDVEKLVFQPSKEEPALAPHAYAAPPEPGQQPQPLASTGFDSDTAEVSRADPPPAADDCYSGSSSSGGEEAEAGTEGGPSAEPSRLPDGPRSASVLVLGRSAHCRGAPAALLGGLHGRRGFALCDFGGGLDGGSGGRRHAAMERAQPVLGAFREFAEELLGMHGQRALEAAGELARRAVVIGGQPVRHRRHLVYLCTAESMLACVGGDPEPPLQAIHLLAKRFEPNSEVKCVAMVPVDELLGGALTASVSPSPPLWGYWGRSGWPWPFGFETCVALERLRELPDQRLLVTSPQGSCGVSPASLQSVHLETGSMRSVFRWDRVALREALVGETGSIATLAQALTMWAQAC